MSRPFLFESDGTSGRTRTGTPVKARDFESLMSTNFITLAQYEGRIIEICTLPSICHAQKLKKTLFFVTMRALLKNFLVELKLKPHAG